MTVNALAAAGDVLIAVVLCFMLQKSRTGFRRYVLCLVRRLHPTDRCDSSDPTP
jgi:hypothetical protein